MNKNVKRIATIVACFTIAGTCLAGPHGGYGGHNAPAPMHHHRPAPPPPPPPPHHVERHHHMHHMERHHHGVGGAVAFGAATIGSVVGGLLGR